MIDLMIFGFGLAVTVIVGSALALLIKSNNRAMHANTVPIAVAIVAEVKGPDRATRSA